jgi:hypothetical protein
MLSSAGHAAPQAPRVARVIEAQDRRDVEELARLERGSAGPGEQLAAERLVEMFAARGVRAHIEHEPAVGDYWRATGFAAAAAALAGVGRRARFARALTAGAAAALIADDVDAGRHLLRGLLPRRSAANVLAWIGDPDAERVVVLVAHHDSARGGLIFHPGLIPAVNRVAPRLYARQTTSTQTGRLMVAGPLLVAAGTLAGVRPLRRLGVLWSAVTAALMADVARTAVVPGANDNLSAVAVLLALARELVAEPPVGVRVVLLSTGSEESFMEGMRGFVARHAGALRRERTSVVAIECVGSPHLAIVEGEGMLRIREYDHRLRDELQAAADGCSIATWRGLRLGAGATDALPALRAGYRAACLAAVNDLKAPSNYHSQADVPENLDWGTIDQAAQVLRGLIRAGA